MRLPAARSLGALLILLATACSGDGGKAAEKTQAELCEEPTRAPDLSKLGDLPLDKFGTVTLVEQKRGFVGAEAISETQIVELFPEMVRELGDEGYVYLGGENEGFEAELAFSSPKDTLASFALRETDCKEQILIRVLIEQGSTEGKGGRS